MASAPPARETERPAPSAEQHTRTLAREPAHAGAAQAPARDEAPQAEPPAAAPEPPPIPEPAPEDDHPPAPTGYATAADPVPPPAYDEDVSQFDYSPPFRARRNPLKLWTFAAAGFAVVALGTVAAVSYWGLPQWVPVERPTFGLEQPDLVLEFPPDQQDRRTLPNGTEFFGASGTVTNVGRETREVPAILIVLRDGRERIVYSWEVTPPKRRLAPGESVAINEAVTDVPRSARFAEIGWKPS